MAESDLTPEQIAIYRSTALRRQEREKEALIRREIAGWSAARKAAKLLKKEFGATRVVVFGSLAGSGMLTRWSDVDIAAWGIEPTYTFKAIGAVMDLDEEVHVNLVDVNTCRPSLLRAIEREGVEI